MVHTAPSGKTYVSVRTSFWVDGFKTVSTPPASVPGQSVTATASPAYVTWALGDPTNPQMTCQDGGSQSGDSCNYTYKKSSVGVPGGSYQVTATITWNIHWTCVGNDCDQAAGDLPAMTMASAPTPLVVGEIQAGSRQ
ncbi:hypothetical protein DZF91_07685 [Actinomadura logoneensis]|uniref:ATP/GTP-binding protein n=1 Tax=Actinomadura logoneensis TaxID=2293572 RepID=A0A372JQC8_9ACTN|nr:hypothetical protein [Actinomadura logoneensis]RFU42221.1 hypothetical protein DZF91_07685 [Actinomadura logoneensis]